MDKMVMSDKKRMSVEFNKQGQKEVKRLMKIYDCRCFSDLIEKMILTYDLLMIENRNLNRRVKELEEELSFS